MFCKSMTNLKFCKHYGIKCQTPTISRTDLGGLLKQYLEAGTEQCLEPGIEQYLEPGTEQ